MKTSVKSGDLVMGGRFRVLRHLGGGGMSEVYLAEQLSLSRKVALKVLKRDIGRRADMAERFRREARLLSTVDHPAVVRVIDFEPAADATILALELAEGETLDASLRRGPMAPQEALIILHQLAEGLGAIHDKGIIHRDLKPQNIVLSPKGNSVQARWLDFGIARLMELNDERKSALGDQVAPDPTVTFPGQVVGTPAFIAPEQATAQPLDARTDVYAFGVLCFRVLSGTFPFDGPTSRDFLVQHVSKAPKKLDVVAPGLAQWPELVKLVMRCLEKMPADRPADGRALAEEIGRIMKRHQADQETSARAKAPPPESAVRMTLGQLQRRATAVRAGSATVVGHLGSGLTGLSREWKLSLAVFAALCAISPVVWGQLPPSPSEQAGLLIQAGKNNEALSHIEAALPKSRGEAPMLLAYKAAALHRLGQHPREFALLSQQPHQVMHALPSALVEAVAEDFGLHEDDAGRFEVFTFAPANRLVPQLVALANGPAHAAQWGALRYLDKTNAVQGLDRIELYGRALHAPRCEVRAAAASRLGQLGDADAIPLLRMLSEQPKDEGEGGDVNCGQDEAAVAIRQLKKK